MFIKHLVLTGALVAIVEIITPGSTFSQTSPVCDNPNQPVCGATLEPNSYCKLIQSITFTPGTYSNSSIEVCADSVTLDGNGAILQNGLIKVQGRTGVTIKNFQFHAVAPDASVIQLYGSSYVIITNCVFKSAASVAGAGIEYLAINYSSNITVEKDSFDLSASVAFQGDKAIRIDYNQATNENSRNVSILDNKIIVGPYQTAIIETSHPLYPNGGHVIERNQILHVGTDWEAGGISVGGSNKNKISDNRLIGVFFGIFVGGDSNTISLNEIEGQPVVSSRPNPGGVLITKNSNLVAGNSISNFRAPGIHLLNETCQNNLIALNNIEFDSIGIKDPTPDFNNNRIYYNNFIDNTIQGQATYFGRFWDRDSTCGGNHWNDFDTPGEGCRDDNADGICDSARTQSGGTPVDRYPFVNRDGWFDKQPPIDSSCIPLPSPPSLRLVPIQSVFLPPPNPGDPYPLVAKKDLVVRAFFDTGPFGPTARARAKFCMDPIEDIEVCFSVQGIEDTGTVYRAGHVFSHSERKLGENSFNFFIRGVAADVRLTGEHKFVIKVEPLDSGAFPAVVDSFRGIFRPVNIFNRTLLNLVFPVVMRDTAPDIEGAPDRMLLDSASNFMRAAFPLDEDVVINDLVVRDTVREDSLLIDDDNSLRFVLKLADHRDVRLLFHRQRGFVPNRAFAVGVLNSEIGGEDPLGGLLGYTFPQVPDVVVTLDRVPGSGKPVIGSTIAHEIGHLYDFGDEYADGRRDIINEPHGEDPDEFGDGSGWYIFETEQAFDVNGVIDSLRRPISVFAVKPPVQPEIFWGYMGNQNDFNSWTRLVNYRHLYNTIIQGAAYFARGLAVSPSRDVIAIKGKINKTDFVEFSPLLISNTDIPLPPLPTGTTYRIELRDSAGTVLNAFNFDVRFAREVLADTAYYDSTEAAPFSFLVDFPLGVTSIVLLKSGISIGSITRSTNLPSVDIISARPKNGGLEVKWQGSDADGDSLTYIVMYAPDTSSRFVVGFDVKDTVFQITFDSTVIPPQRGILVTQASVTVHASDGFNYAEATAPVFFCPCTRGDPNCDLVDCTPSDLVCILLCVFTGEEAPPSCHCEDVCIIDADCDGLPTPSDFVHFLLKCFLGTPLPCQ